MVKVQDSNCWKKVGKIIDHIPHQSNSTSNSLIVAYLQLASKHSRVWQKLPSQNPNENNSTVNRKEKKGLKCH